MLGEIVNGAVDGLTLTEQIAEGWRYGPCRDDEKKLTPCLVPYGELPEVEKEYDRITALETLKRGYLTAEGGFRVGVTGFAVRQNGATVSLRDFSSMAIRIARERIGLAADLTRELRQEGRFLGTVIAAAPGAGMGRTPLYLRTKLTSW